MDEIDDSYQQSFEQDEEEAAPKKEETHRIRQLAENDLDSSLVEVNDVSQPKRRHR